MELAIYEYKLAYNVVIVLLVIGLPTLYYIRGVGKEIGQKNKDKRLLKAAGLGILLIIIISVSSTFFKIVPSTDKMRFQGEQVRFSNPVTVSTIEELTIERADARTLEKQEKDDQFLQDMQKQQEQSNQFLKTIQ